MMTQAEFDALLQRYLTGHSLAGEQRLVESWSRQLGQDENLLLPPGLQQEVRAAMWQHIVQLTQKPEASAVASVPVARQPRTAWQAPALRWAAVALLGLGASWWLSRQVPVATAPPHWACRTNAGPLAHTMQLADGSRVTLYAGSTLRYQAGLPGARREVYLTGRAFFKVAKNPARPFLVYTDKLLTTVLGTSFLVTAYAGQPAKVAVREGRVAVQPRQGAELAATPTRPASTGVLLLPNQQVVYAASAPHLDKALVDNPIRLEPQPLAFRNRPVPEVLSALEKAYGVNIVYDPAKLRNCTITVTFGDETLFEQLDTLCKALDAKYKMANNAQIIFESYGCKLGRQ